MRVLWVEDQFSKEKQDAWFGNSPGFEVEVVKDYTEAQNVISNNMARYDLAILDIDLTVSDSNTNEVVSKAQEFGIDEQTFLRESGFHLYVQLLEQGFDKDRVVFLTGNVSETPLQHAVWSLKQAYKEKRKQEVHTIFNGEIRRSIPDADFQHAVILLGKEDLWAYLDKQAEDGASPSNTYNQFKQRFHVARMTPPHAIRKKADHDTLVDIAIWLRPRLNNPYLRLRYAIVEMVGFIDERLKDDEQILFNRYVPKTEQQFSQDDLRAYLYNLSALLPQREPSDDLKARIYKQLLRALVHEFDKAEWNSIKKVENNPLVRILKTLRNWMAHGKSVEPPSEILLAYLFWLNCRVMFDFGSKQYLPIERSLAGVFDQQPAEDAFEDAYPQLYQVMKRAKQELENKIEKHNQRTGSYPVLDKHDNGKPITRFIDLANAAQRNTEFCAQHGTWLLNRAYCFFWESNRDKSVLNDSNHYLGAMARCLWHYSFAD